MAALAFERDAVELRVARRRSSLFGVEPVGVISALMMLRRIIPAFRYAVREQEFLTIFGAGVTLAAVGTITFTLGADWNPVDAFYFTVSTLTTTSVSDPDLVLQDGWLKIFAVFFQLVGIGVLVEILRRLGIAFIAVRAAEKSS